MRMQPLLSLGAAAGLSACAAAAVPPAGGALPGAQAVAMGSAIYQAAILPGRAGKALTAEGAVSVPGLTVQVAGLDRDQGKLAKDVAQQACGQAGGQFRPQVVGGFAAGQWYFEGGCA